MKKYLFCLLLFCGGARAIFALNAPELRCLQINPDGQVLLTWIAPSDLSALQSYDIFYSTDNVNFSLVVNVSSASTSYTHNINANTVTSLFYYIEAISTASNRYRSNTMSVINFYLSNSGMGYAQLNWFIEPSFLLPSFDAQFIIERKPYYSSSFDVRAYIPTSQSAYQDVIDLCYGEIEYRVVLEDVETGCRNISRVQKDIFQDFTDPFTPVLDSVSVNFVSGITCLGWEPSPSGDVNAYIIYYLELPAGWIPVDTVYGYQNTFWEDYVHEPSSGTGQYLIAALDSCMRSSPLSEYQNVIRLTQQYDPCRSSVLLKWNAYENMKDGVLGYNILYSVNQAPLQFENSVNANTHQYTMPNILPESDYEIIVQVINSYGTISATSISVSFNSGDVGPDHWVYCSGTKVVDNQYIDLTIMTSGDSLPFSVLKIYRSVNDAANFIYLTDIQYNDSSEYHFKDDDVDVNNILYYYQAELLNECDFPVTSSNIIHNLIVKGEAMTTRINKIYWENPTGWEQGVLAYSVERKTQVSSIFEQIYTLLPSSTNRYEDDVAELFLSGSDFKYRIIAAEKPNQYGISGQHVSNAVLVKQDPATVIANAFAPDGKNKIFNPVNHFVPEKGYDFRVYSRYGQLVFQSFDPYQGWDGNYDDQPAPMGVYTYRLVYTLPNGDLFKQRGSVTLVR
ncbi:MAG: gliding motility-associated C-terminal domain-containing protein [Bacteroidales bacterium]|jgi:gliding motility-associated-like protein|nr:gliding motility-associated C-terminal domain-containing protein [Bacteroidales bacterium]